MTLEELYDALSNVLPANWQAGEDNDGQLVIYTGLTCDQHNNLLFYGEDE